MVVLKALQIDDPFLCCYLSAGYTELVEIPAGAFNIRIYQVQISRDHFGALS